MPADYGEVLRDLDAQIASLEAEIATLRAGRSTIVILRNKYGASTSVAPVTATAPSWNPGPYAQMGPTAAIRLLLTDQPFALTTAEIVDKLKAGGLTTKGADLSGNVSSTLSRLKEHRVVEKVGDGWKLRHVDKRTASEVLQATVDDLRLRKASASELPSVQ